MSAYTFAGRVKQRSLERDNLHVVQVFFDGHLNCEASIWIHIWEGQQICGAHKEVPVERVDGQTCKKTKRDKINQTPNYNFQLENESWRVRLKAFTS